MIARLIQCGVCFGAMLVVAGLFGVTVADASASKLTTIYEFCLTNCNDGAEPGQLAQDLNGNLFSASRPLMAASAARERFSSW